LIFNHQIPYANTSSYLCYGFYTPDLVTDLKTNKTHIVAIDIDIKHAEVHHILLRRCAGPSDYFDAHVGGLFGDDCLSGAGGVTDWREIAFLTPCFEMVYGWAVGTTKWILPEIVGLPLSDFQYLLVEVHYNNPSQNSYVQNDTSTVIIEYIQEPEPLHKYDGGGTIGSDPSLMMPPIPKGTPWLYRFLTCPGECTQTMEAPITVFAIMLHMHIWARMGSIALYRQGQFIREIAYAAHYEFHNQGIWNIDPITVNPGDDIIFSCGWNTSTATQDVTMGKDTTNEMCTLVMYWYPKLAVNPIPGCGLGFNSSSTFCGGVVMDGPNPVPSVATLEDARWKTTKLRVSPDDWANLAPSQCQSVPAGPPSTDAGTHLQISCSLLMALLVWLSMSGV